MEKKHFSKPVWDYWIESCGLAKDLIEQLNFDYICDYYNGNETLNGLQGYFVNKLEKQIIMEAYDYVMKRIETNYAVEDNADEGLE